MPATPVLKISTNYRVIKVASRRDKGDIGGRGERKLKLGFNYPSLSLTIEEGYPSLRLIDLILQSIYSLYLLFYA